MPAPKGNPFAKGNEDANMPEFLKARNAPAKESHQTADDLKNMNAGNFSLGDATSQRRNPFSIPSGDAKYSNTVNNY